MSRPRALLVGVLLALAVLVQSGVLARLNLPGGEPALLVLLVACVAWADGPLAGMIVGFLAGLLADLAPPAGAPLGSSALVLVLVGELVGLLRRHPTGLARPLFVVGLAATFAGFATAAVGAVLQQPQLPPGRLTATVLASAAYTVALTPFVMPLVGVRRVRVGRRSRRRMPSPGPAVGGSLGRSAAPGGLR